ncbi:MAG: Cys-Gln thioester bond-forming surface protein, partial [Oscillospiraceae bacterium]|nr:Cys-Gln thioester bond-forming surface protein [Oscillospiraceae bacterium]
MARKARKVVAWMLVLVMLTGMMGITSFAADANDNPFPEVTVTLTPEKETTTTADKNLEDGSKLTRVVTANTSAVEVATKQTAGELEAIQPALKFDRNSTADQKAQMVARELYTDNGHFHDPSTFTVTDAPEGYPFKYVGHGDYSGHYVSHVKVVYARDEAGNAIKDANGNYVIKELQHASSGTPLHYGTELTTNIDGPYHYATGTRSQQFLLMDEERNTYYGYCIDLATGANNGTWYALANLEDNDYYASEEAEDHVRGIVFNGYWGTKEGTGSLASLKEALKASSVEREYTIKQVNRKKFTTGYELQEGEYHYGSYVYWDVPAVDVTLTDEIIDQMTEGEALDAMQAAIWSWANGSQATLNGVDGVIVGDMSVASSAMSDSLNGKNDPEGAARTRALYAYLMNQKVSADEAKTVIVNDKTFVEDMSLTVGEQISANAYKASLRFSNSFTFNKDKDDLKIVLTYMDALGETVTITKSLTGEGALVADENGYYTIDGLKLNSANPFEFTLNIVGEQYLTKNAYIFTSQKGVNGSQTFVSLAEGNISVDVSKSVSVDFGVKNEFIPKDPTEHIPEPPNPSADKTDREIETNHWEVEIAVPGEDGSELHDEVILMVDGSYSGDNEWPAMKEAITTIGKTVLNGSGNTQLTLMAFGMGDNEVLVHVKDADELAAALGELPGNLLRGVSSTNCEAGFTGVDEYIKNHDKTLNEVQVIYITDGGINTDETLRQFYNWRDYAPNKNSVVGYAVDYVDEATLLDAVALIVDDFAGTTRQDAYTAIDAASETEVDAIIDYIWAKVFTHSNMLINGEYPISEVERAFLQYNEDYNCNVSYSFLLAMKNSKFDKYPNVWQRTYDSVFALAENKAVADLYLVRYTTDSRATWMPDAANKSAEDNIHYVKSDSISTLCNALQGALTDLAKTPFNDVYVTDYMSKWVNLDASTLKIVDNSTGKVIWTVDGGWADGVTPPTAKNPPVVVEKVDASEYEAGGDDVIGNTSGDIYKLTWYVKDGAMLRSDTYSLKYEVFVDTA